MKTPILMCLLMMGPAVFVGVCSYLLGRSWDGRGAAAIGLGVLFVFTGVGHFVKMDEMVLMLPVWVPWRELWVVLTGVFEFGLALCFFVPKTRVWAGWVSVGMLVSFLPVNVYAAMNYIPMGGHVGGPVYLLVRVPLQLLILGWVYWFVLRAGERVSEG